MRNYKTFLIFLISLFTLIACKNQNQQEVVIYTSVDQVFSEPILAAFEQETGIKVQPVYDVEAAKTTGLVNRLIAEKNNPQADVFWNGEFAQTLLLQEENVLSPYLSPNAETIPEAYKDPQGYWTGFSGRARVLIINTDLLQPTDYPDSIMDLLDSGRNAEKIGFAYPLFGTTATQAAALYTLWGEQQAEDFFQQLADRDIKILDGNSVIRDKVVSGELAFGMTDTDDACTALKQGDPVQVVFPDQSGDQMGTLIVPNTVALIAGGPNPKNGEVLIDYLLSTETAQEMMEREWTHLSLRGLESTSDCYPDLQVKGMNIPLDEIYNNLLPAKKALSEIFIR